MPEPLALLHGITGSGHVWREVVPLLSDRFEVIVLDALGHGRGRRVSERPVRIEHVVDDAERTLDEAGIERAHLAGNSMGGWVALELARRGRARSVCAFSPAGLAAGGFGPHGSLRGIARMARDARRYRALLPLGLRVAPLRRYALSLNAVHGERVDRRHILDMTDDVIACDAWADLLASEDRLAALDPAPCPITIAWGRHDRVFSCEPSMARARELVPGAEFLILEDAAHVPMFDDPELVARTIDGAAQRPGVSEAPA